MLDLIEDLLGGDEVSRRRHGRMDHAPTQRIEARRARETRDLDVAETVVGEPRLPSFDALAFQRVGVARFRALDVVAVDHAVIVEKLGETQSNFGTARARDAQLHPAGEILAEVIDGDARLRRPHVHGHKRIHNLNGRKRFGGEFALRGRNELGHSPTGVVENRLIPARSLQPRVIRFAVINAVARDRPVFSLP